MDNFTAQMNEAIATYAAMSGIPQADIIVACKDMDCQTARIIALLMVAAR